MAQPALSRQLAALEREVGAQLLERHARGVRLLPAGEAFLARARRILAEAESGVSEARGSVNGETRCVRVAIPDWPARAAWVARAIHDLQARRPDVVVRHEPIFWLQSEQAIRARTLDVGFAIAALPGDFPDDIEVDRICDEPATVAIIPAAHPLATKSEISLADLRDLTVLAPPRDLVPRLHDQTVAMVRSAGYEPRVMSAPPSFGATVHFVIAGAGWMPSVNSAAEGLPSGVRAIPIADASAVAGFYLLRRRGNENDAVEAFAESLREVARSNS